MGKGSERDGDWVTKSPVYYRRFKKNQRHNKRKKVQPFFQERQNKKRKASVFSTEGDRQFTQWKGSIVDSVAGVFLTQNVSDNLSRFRSTFQNIVECSNTESKDGVDICYHSTSAENVTKKVKSALMSEKSFINRLILEQGNVDLEWLREVQPEKGVLAEHLWHGNKKCGMLKVANSPKLSLPGKFIL
ncbi:hypothetical protein RND71_040221 [Anisodus tanguticus]|uniref:Uncharacterized protein n=1 Tax=Anisodus tanguticus TaxID=243964 RepID=A0AAE1QXZ4_9SOLA|nr:hypothetical protein RND71_040221 [Anisodus tanguticus]